ncbi:hypothetical protein QVD17_01776 [Tagetes erecta]|uniref:Hepatoma-derived growth factor-related protein 2-like n=1 Tax=Tagetes erecta TaxID=13708 RepID=A0AAD8LBB2_TARER|nr:hypothetical protein QVD17_01776 [Tagetes erecta]
MADDDSFLTDSDDERAVEDLLSQAKDHSVLEQIAAINCSSFSNSDNLPFDLENRFRKLKSLPTTTTSGAGHRLPPSKSKSFTPQSRADSNSNERKSSPSDFVEFEHDLDLKKCSEKSSPSTDNPEEHSRSKLKPKSASNTDEICKPKGLKSKSKPKPRTGSSESRSDSWSMSSPESESRSVSPARRGIGCLWCSPKKEKRKQGKENRLSSSSSWGNDYDVEFLKTFSVKEQKRIMKQAMKEEEKINKEAEKIVKWAKQASSRMMNVSGLDDEHELTDDEDTKR